MQPILFFHCHLQKTTILIKGRLVLIDKDKDLVIDTYIATSGSRQWQEPDNIKQRGSGPIPPPTQVGIPHYIVKTKPIYMPQIKGIKGNFYKIDPHEVVIEGIERGDFGIHRDENVPGSAGCIVLTTDVGWDGFQAKMRELAASGIDKIPLLISYAKFTV